MRHAGTALAVLTAALLLPCDASAQQTELAHAALDLGVRTTPIAGSATVLFGGAGLLGTGGRLMVGGGGWVQLAESDLETGGADAGFRLRVAYGGLVVDWLLAERPRGNVALRTLLGAGNGKVFLRTAGIGTETGADNFGVFEPEVAIDWHLSERLHAGAGLSYRAVFGLEDLTGVSSGDVRGPALRIGLSLLAS